MLKPLPINSFNAGVGAADAIKNHTFTHHYEWFVEKGARYTLPSYPKRWDEINIQTFGENKSVMCVPREAKSYIKDQVYDYPLIEANLHDVTNPDHDIVFISYDEPNAEKRFNALKQRFPRAKWSKDILGQTVAYMAAASMSRTDYFFAVFPKLEIVDSFNFDFQPDRMKNPCHYIFNCKNPVNGLEYGHGAVILYNKDLVMKTTNPGLDFTLSAPHEVVPILSAINYFNETPWLAWRTAFREVIKLLQATPTVEGTYRLEKWLAMGEGKNADWVYKGANDAKKFYDKNHDKHGELMLSYDFEWLKKYYESKY